MTFQPVYQCDQCGAKVKPDQDICIYCGYYLRQTQVKITSDTVENLVESTTNYTCDITSRAIEIIVGFILAMIALLIGVNLIGPIWSVLHP